MTRQHIGESATQSSFQRDGLEAIKGIDTRTARTLESLPQSRDAIVTAIDDLVDDTNAIEGEPILLFADPTDPILGNVRKLIGGDNVSLTIGAEDAALDLTDTGVVADPYGDASHVIAITVDVKGRIVSAQAFPLNSDNVTEGVVHLFFTNARARAALSGGAGIDYNSTTGAIALGNSGVTAGTYAPPASITVDAYGRVTAIS